MSVEVAKAFLLRAQEDEALRAQVYELSKDSEATVEQGLKIAADAGFVFTSEDFVAASSTTGDLSDDELENVSGGYVPSLPPGGFQNPPGF